MEARGSLRTYLGLAADRPLLAESSHSILLDSSNLSGRFTPIPDTQMLEFATY